jgi:hypothetical protein
MPQTSTGFSPYAVPSSLVNVLRTKCGSQLVQTKR